MMENFLNDNGYKPGQYEQGAWFSPEYNDGQVRRTIKIVKWADKVRAVCMVKYRTELGPNSTAIEIYIGDNEADCVSAIKNHLAEVERRTLQQMGL